MNSFTELQSCHATQITTDSKTTKWIVKNEKNDVLYELPTHWSEQDVMDAIHFARKFELIAFENGVEEMKNKMLSKINNLKITYENTVDFLKSENIRLSNILEQYLIEEEN